MNVLLGIFYHTLGSFSSGSFMAPYVKIKKWNFENYWILMGLFAWILAPALVAWFTVPHIIYVIFSSPSPAIIGAFSFGFFWGIGAVTFGLAVRYLGYSLGYALTLGLSSIIGTLLPPIYERELLPLFFETSGQILLIGLAVNFTGIIFCIKAGRSKDKEIGEQLKNKQNSEYNYSLGLIVAVICGLFASFTGFGITAGKGISQTAIAHGTSAVMSNNATLVVLLWGGFFFNLLYYLVKTRKSNIASEFIRGEKNIQYKNYFFSGLSGTLWYLQYMFYGMGTTQMGRYDFISWTIHMTLIIAFSTLWGLLFKEWKSCSKKTRMNAIMGILIIIFSTMIIGFSTYLSNQAFQ